MSRSYSLTVEALTLSPTTSSLPNGVLNTTYTPQTFSATGGLTPYIFSATGQPSGLAINPTTGVLSGGIPK